MKRAALLAALLCFGFVGAEAQTSLADSLESARRSASDVLRSPLDRRITLQLRDVALREALDRLALIADIRISYSGDNIPLDRRVSVERDTAPVSLLLGELLRTYPVQPVAVADDHIVLIPRAPVPGDVVSSIAVLDRVVVMGNVVGGSERPLPVALDVVSGRQIERREEAGLAKVLSGSVPGVWMWEQTPTSMLARYGSIRGSSSFGLSFPKVYIDGVEVANPLLLTEITPELVERIEVIRGPQGAALYGSDAISGVVNVVSRHEGADPEGSHARIRSAVGYAASAFTPGAVAVQEHALTLRAGSNLRSAGITIGASTSGQYIPQAHSRELRSIADGRIITARSTLTANARFYAKRAGVPLSPLLVALDPDEIESDFDPQRLRMYSLGSTFTLAPTERWTYSMTAGVDGYSLENVSIEQSPIPSVADSVLRNASGSALRGTLRASAVTRLGDPERLGATFTISAEQSALRDKTSAAETDNSGSGSFEVDSEGWSQNAGITTQANLALADALFITAGIRRERLDQPHHGSTSVTLPMLGAALVRDYAGVTWKLRGAYGKGVRSRHSTMAAIRVPKRTLLNPDLDPEQQAGIEAGADVHFGRRLAVHITHFDQVASGLIQTVTIPDPSGGNSGTGNSRSRTWFQLQNVGEISNRGWEAQMTVAIDPVSIQGAATVLDSRVQKLAPGYTGDLRAGDRMLAVPARTLSGTASWLWRGFHLSSTVSRGFDWIDYDRLAIATELITTEGDATDLTGENLRAFWTNYRGATRLRASLSLPVWRETLITLTGENLLNHQRGEPDSITIVPGRTIMLGVRARF